MTRIRKLEIRNFRCFRHFEWVPSPGINCLIGPGDSGKSTILDAIDLCLGARRTATFSDADFNNLDVTHDIEILVTVGDLDERFLSLDAYGLYTRGFDHDTKHLHDEPHSNFEPVLTVKLVVSSDLEPGWCLYSDRAHAQGQAKILPWADKVRLSPTRIGVLAYNNLSWQRGSVLNRVSEERADTSATLAAAARQARSMFGDTAEEQLGGTLQIVAQTATELGIGIGQSVKALLDTHSVSFVGGTVSLHDEHGVPLRNLGTGSTRLLIAGLQRRAADSADIILIDELEHGLEPHRIIRLLNSLGSKEAVPPLQAFLTTHSPAALRELSGNQLYILRRQNRGDASVSQVGTSHDAQGTMRLYPEAFLAGSILVCEGASEVGFIRGLDQYLSKSSPSVFACGTSLLNAEGISKIYGRAVPLQNLGYRVATLRDDDVSPDAADETAFDVLGGSIFKWEAGQSIEAAIFTAAPNAAIQSLLNYAVHEHGPELIEAHLAERCPGLDLDNLPEAFSVETRANLARAAQMKSNSWFKTVSRMEVIGREIIGPELAHCQRSFVDTVEALFVWARHVQP